MFAAEGKKEGSALKEMKMFLRFIECMLLIYCSDYSGVSEAYEAMKNVASLINERKRRLESIDTIAHWQVAILHWEVKMAINYSSSFFFLKLILEC